MTTRQPGRLLGVGLGPGDPDLVTIKAARLVREAPVVAWFCKEGRRGHARGIADALISPDCEQVALAYPVTTEIAFSHPDYVAALRAFYAAAAETLAFHLDRGRDVALLCEGDPLFYGSFMHLYVRLRARYAVEIVPGVSGMSGCWTAAGVPMTWGDDILAVLPGTLPAATLRTKLEGVDAAVIMKIGAHLASVREAVAQAGRLDEAIYVERGTMAGERIVPLAELPSDTAAPYFSIILVPGNGRRP